MVVSVETQPITMKNKKQRQENSERRTQVCILLFGNNTFIIYYSVYILYSEIILGLIMSPSITELYCIVLYLYIYIALLAVHTNQKRFQCERPREKKEKSCKVLGRVQVPSRVSVHPSLVPILALGA